MDIRYYDVEKRKKLSSSQDVLTLFISPSLYFAFQTFSAQCQILRRGKHPGRGFDSVLPLLSLVSLYLNC